jgi:hypothetical protein
MCLKPPCFMCLIFRFFGFCENFHIQLWIMIVFVERQYSTSTSKDDQAMVPMGWTNDGLSVAIRDDKLVNDMILPQFAFGSSKLSSFIRYVLQSTSNQSINRSINQ